MACLSRILRFNRLKQCVPLVRNITSNNAVITSELNKIIFTNHNSWIWQKNDKIEAPVNKSVIDLPNGLKYVLPLLDPMDTKELELPTTDNGGESKEAARLIVIRRRKMKRHKLKKLRKRMKYEWAKRRQRREWKKEKEFQAVLIQQCKEAEAFSAEKYVEEKLAKFNELSVNSSRKKKSGLSHKNQM